MRKIVLFIVSILTIILLYSCHLLENPNYHLYPGKTEIISIETDDSLQDSVMIYGEIYDCFGEHLIIGNRIFEIYTKEKIFCTKTNTAYFQMTIPAGKYTITCEGEHEDNTEHMCNLNLTTKLNQKIKIKFLYGETDE